MWIAREENGELFLYSSKPFKDGGEWNFDYSQDAFMPLDENLFPNITWEDEEPTEVEIVIKKIN